MNWQEICCASYPCSRWSDGLTGDGICRALVIHKDGHTSCENIKKGSNPFPNGCMLRTYSLPETFELLKERAESLIGRKLLGVGGNYMVENQEVLTGMSNSDMKSMKSKSFLLGWYSGLLTAVGAVIVGMGIAIIFI